MRIEHVHPGEPSALAAADPVQRRVDDLAGRALGQGEVGGVARPAEAVVVDVEPAVEPEPPLERHAADEGARREPCSFSIDRDRRQCPASAGIRCDRGRRSRTGRCRSGCWRGTAASGPRARARSRNAVPRAASASRLGVRARPAVAAERVGPERVDGDEEQVLIRPAIDIGPPRPAPVTSQADTRRPKVATANRTTTPWRARGEERKLPVVRDSLTSVPGGRARHAPSRSPGRSSGPSGIRLLPLRHRSSARTGSPSSRCTHRQARHSGGISRRTASMASSTFPSASSAAASSRRR